MDSVLNLFLLFILIISVLVIALINSAFVGLSVRAMNASSAPWNLYEFLLFNPSKRRHNEYYRFNEESVRSHAYRFLGRFDTAILHWKESPILDIMIERKFPENTLPDRVKEEDVFQAGLYTLALSESGVSCNETQLVIIYCLQDNAKRCVEGNSSLDCWRCSNCRKFLRRFNERDVRKHLKRLDEVWYNKRNPKPSPSQLKCKSCPYGKNGKCNYAEY